MSDNEQNSGMVNPAPAGDGVSRLEGDAPIDPHFRCGYVAIVGLPNVGKSTLMNTLLSQKVSIVTPKPQTTRHKILGILSSVTSQVVFLDTPGLLKPKYLLQEVMMGYAESALADADLNLLMIDATDPDVKGGREHAEMAKHVTQRSTPAFLVINKTDKVHKPDLLPLIDSYARSYPFKEIFPISARKQVGTSELLASVIGMLPEHPPFYPLDIVGEQSERFFVAEIVREKIFLLCKEEIPYSTTVDVVEFREKEEGKTLIEAEIYVERVSQRGIIVGKQGAMLKEIGTAARRDIEVFLQRPVFLQLTVKVREAWRKNRGMLDRLGYKS